MTITKSIYINGTHGAGYGSILNVLVNGVIINITDAADVRKAVRLRALDINGASQGTNGVSILSANNVWIEDSVIDGQHRRRHQQWNGHQNRHHRRDDHECLCVGYYDPQEHYRRQSFGHHRFRGAEHPRFKRRR